MILNARQSAILQTTQMLGQTCVDDLASRFSVTAQTIRRDLSQLAEAGLLQRTHGGAVANSGVSNIAYGARQHLHEEEKSAIAQACAQRIPNDSSLFLNVGTSTEAVARALLGHHRLTVITNNINVANILAANEHCQIIVASGILRRADGGLIGDHTRQFMQQFKTDFAIIGTSAIDQDGDLLDFDLHEIGVSQAIIGASRKTYLVTDSSKFSRSAPARIASLKDIDCLFSDAVPEAIRSRCQQWQTQIITTQNSRSNNPPHIRDPEQAINAKY